MRIKSSRINVFLDRPLYEAIQKMAKRDGVPLSLKARDLIREALEVEEDLVLAKFAEEREATFQREKALTHEQFWAHLRKKS